MDEEADFEITEMETTTNDELEEHSFRERCNTWHGSLPEPQTAEETDHVEEDKTTSNSESQFVTRKPSTRRNAWGNMSYAELITCAIESSSEKRMTLAQIYDWIVKNIPFFQDKSDSCSSAGWKNSVRHNLSLHPQFMKLQNEGTGKSSWWIVKQDTGTQRRRARTMESGMLDRKNRKGKLKVSATFSKTDDITKHSEVNENLMGYRCRSSSNASSCGRLSPIQAEVEMDFDRQNQVECSYVQWNQPPQVTGPSSSSECLLTKSNYPVSEPATGNPSSVSSTQSWQNFSMTLNDSCSLITATGQTGVLLAEGKIQVPTVQLQEDQSNLSQPRMVVLLAAPQTIIPRLLQAATIGSTSIKGLEVMPNINVCTPTSSQHSPQELQQSQQQILPLPEKVASSNVLPTKSTTVVVKSIPPANVGASESYSSPYLQCLKLLKSDIMRQHMRAHPDFLQKFRQVLLAKREQMMQEKDRQAINNEIPSNHSLPQMPAVQSSDGLSLNLSVDLHDQFMIDQELQHNSYCDFEPFSGDLFCDDFFGEF